MKENWYTIVHIFRYPDIDTSKQCTAAERCVNYVRNSSCVANSFIHMSFKCVFVLVSILHALFASRENLRAQFCSKLQSRNRSCSSDNILCDHSLTSVVPHEIYQRTCTTDSPFRIDMDRLHLRSTQCTDKSKGDMYFWMALFVKDDSRNVVEWLAWHLSLGVNHIIVYDNESVDNLRQALLPLINAKLVTYLLWSGRGISAQQSAYRHAIMQTEAKNVSWLGIIDVDEFLLPIKHKCLPSMLSSYDNAKNVSAIAVNWRMMPGKYQLSNRNLVYRSIFERTEFSLGYPNRHIKSIIKPHFTKDLLTAHAASYSQGYTAVSLDSMRPTNDSFNYPPEVRDAVILHYHVKSLEEWLSKKDRWRNGMSVQRCPTCHQPLDKVVTDWLSMQSCQATMYKNEYQRHCDNKTDADTTKLMVDHSRVLKEILSYDEQH